jgi:hypothetical protein
MILNHLYDVRSPSHAFLTGFDPVAARIKRWAPLQNGMIEGGPVWVDEPTIESSAHAESEVRYILGTIQKASRE